MAFLVQMQRDVGTFLTWAMRVQAGSSPQAELARNVILAVLVAQMVAAAQHDGPPHAARRAPRYARPKRKRLAHRDSLAGRRPRG